jgi:hypothetical protein
MPSSLPTPPLRLTDDQFATVLRAAEPLHPRDRAGFVAAVAAVLAGQTATRFGCSRMADGLVSRVCRELQRRFLPVAPEVPREQSRWSSRRSNGVRG